jgi:fatty acid desaturase
MIHTVPLPPHFTVSPAQVIPLPRPVPVPRRRLLGGHARIVAVTFALAAWVLWMVLALTAHWSVLAPMVTGGVIALAWGIAGDVYHHRREHDR